ncbi:hypothetical protein HYR69_03205 [Candidatus Sumerlaeota bacterium]|nr:hypothetical protein [Candidatus Sumerlaeota bacterium]
MRLRKEGSAHPMLGMGTDDTHAYFKQRIGLANAGRGWVMVLADKLTPDVLIEAMKRGDFYPTSGVILDEISSDKKSFRVAIKPEDGISYTTQFIGTRKGFDASSKPALDDAGKEMFHATRQYSGEIGIILKETRENPAVYEFKGDEMYVRAKVVSSKLKANPHAEGDREMAWTQPVVMK